MNYELIENALSRGFGDIHIKLDQATGLIAIVAIHSTKLGPALGGCRCIEYVDFDAALNDALRLARAMSFKAAVLNLPHGGGKSVLLKPKHIVDRHAYFTAFGRFVAELGGRYITAIDSGTATADMDIIAKQTSYVTCTSAMTEDTSWYTAVGTFLGIEAAVRHKLNRTDLKGLHVAIQGLGHVGHFLAKELVAAGARITVTDVSQEAVTRCVTECGATAVQPDEIYGVACDIFAPCALGAVINQKTLPQIRASIIAGCANNQLEAHEFGEAVHQRGILFAPDFVINAGGLVYAASCYDGDQDNVIKQRLSSIPDSLTHIFERSRRENTAPNTIAELIAQERIAS